jgi:hypothetical protein
MDNGYVSISIQYKYFIEYMYNYNIYPMGLHIRHSLCKCSPSITKDIKLIRIINDVLLKGSPDLSFDDNVLIMNSVHTFICGTKRLDYQY